MSVKHRVCAVVLALLSFPLQLHAAAQVYTGRESPIGVPAGVMQSAGTGTADFLAAQGVRLGGERIFAGYRSACGLGVEGAQYSAAAHDLMGMDDAWSVAGTVAVPITERWTANAKAGLHVDQSQVPAIAARPASLLPDKVVGFGLAYRLRDNIEMAFESQRYTGHAATTLSAVPSAIYLLGARVRF